jgi:glycosyltransferase involved in cell wall biosynthesis
MRILLAQNMYYLPSHGGANKSNRFMLEQLAGRGHDCFAVAPLTGRLTHVSMDALPSYLTARGGEILQQSSRGLTYEYAGVTVHGVTRGPDLPRAVRDAVTDLAPDWVLVPSDDPGMLVLSSVRRATDRIVYLLHTLQQLPFGPRSFYPGPRARQMVEDCAGFVSVSQAAQDYLRRWAGLSSELIRPDVYTDVPVRMPDPRRQRYVTLVNPCAYKGVDILLALADELPDVAFLAVQSWGTTSEDLAALALRPNITVQPAVDDMDQVFGRTRILLMPSLWDETFGYTAVEAMLRGIPVLCSDVGGLCEAALGVQQPIAVRPITGYVRAGSALPQPVVPAQDTGPWKNGVRRLLIDEGAWRRSSAASRTAAEDFVSGMDQAHLERYLGGLAARAGQLAVEGDRR